MDVRGYVPAAGGRTSPVVINPWSDQSIGAALQTTGQGSAGLQNYIAANVGVFVPFVIYEAVTFTKLGVMNADAVAGNIDLGLFQEDGTLIVAAGTTAQSGVSAQQTVDITDTSLARGRYYLGITGDTGGVTQKVYGVVPVAGIAQALGLLEDSSCAPPFSTSANPATFVAYSRAFIPLIMAQGFRVLGT
jgi:hypothetical protein